MTERQLELMASRIVGLCARVKELEAEVERLESNSHPPVDVRAVVREILDEDSDPPKDW